MAHFSVEKKYLFLKALVFSLCFHALFAQIFIITFPAKKLALKPVFIFWGSILPQRDFSFSDPSNYKNANLKLQKPKMIEHPVSAKPHNTDVRKPGFTVTSINQKNQYKSTLEEFSFKLKEEPAADPLPKLGIETSTPARLPLKLPTDDKN